jgi:hypothetical protein
MDELNAETAKTLLQFVRRARRPRLFYAPDVMDAAHELCGQLAMAAHKSIGLQSWEHLPRGTVCVLDEGRVWPALAPRSLPGHSPLAGLLERGF